MRVPPSVASATSLSPDSGNAAVGFASGGVGVGKVLFVKGFKERSSDVIL